MTNLEMYTWLTNKGDVLRKNHTKKDLNRYMDIYLKANPEVADPRKK